MINSKGKFTKTVDKLMYVLYNMYTTYNGGMVKL